MKKIFLVKTNGVKVNAISLPIKFGDVTKRIVIPLCNMIKKKGNYYGFNYRSGLTESEEKYVIDYYNKVALKIAVQALMPERLCDLYELGVTRAKISKSVTCILIENLLGDIDEQVMRKYCLDYIKQGKEMIKLRKKYKGVNLDDEGLMILDKLTYDKVSEAICNAMEDKKYYAKLVETIVVPYIKEEKRIREEEERKRQEEIEAAKKKVEELEALLFEAKKKLALM